MSCVQHDEHLPVAACFDGYCAIALCASRHHNAATLPMRILPRARAGRNASAHICPVDFDVTGLKSNNNARLGVIPDSDDLKSQAVFAPYRCLFSWPTRQHHESRSVGFRAVVGFCAIQSLRAFGRSVRVEPRYQAFLGPEPLPLHRLFLTHPTRGLARSGGLSELDVTGFFCAKLNVDFNGLVACEKRQETWHPKPAMSTRFQSRIHEHSPSAP
jgi:hypothetical protein